MGDGNREADSVQKKCEIDGLPVYAGQERYGEERRQTNLGCQEKGDM